MMNNLKQTTCMNMIFIIIVCLFSNNLKAQAFSWLSKPDQQAGLELNGSTGAAKISANGRYVAFISDASNIVTGDDNQRADLFIQDSLNQTVQRFELSVELRSFSAPTSDGRYIVLTTESTDPVNFSQPNLVYLIDTVEETFTLQNLDLNGDLFTLYSQIFLADDGSQMIFYTDQNLSPMHTNSSNQIYAKNLDTNQHTLLSIAPGREIAESLFRIYDVSVNQQYIAIISFENSNLLPGVALNGNDNLLILDLSDNSYTLGTIRPDGTSSMTGFFGPRSVSISNSGQVVYISDMSDLVSGDNNDDFDVFLFDGTTNSRINLDSNGSELSASVSIADRSVISPDDSIISYSSFSDQLVGNDNNETYDTFIYNINSGTTTRASSVTSGEAAGDSTFPTAISTNGEKLLMRSYAKDFGLGRVINGQQQNYLYSVGQQQITQMLPHPQLAVNTAHSSIDQSHISSDQLYAFMFLNHLT